MNTPSKNGIILLQFLIHLFKKRDASYYFYDIHTVLLDHKNDHPMLYQKISQISR